MTTEAGNDPTGTAKLDSAATEGLEGVSNSIAYRVHEIEKQFHNYESWREASPREKPRRLPDGRSFMS